MNLLASAGAVTEVHWEMNGHSLTRTEVDAAAKWYKKIWRNEKRSGEYKMGFLVKLFRKSSTEETGNMTKIKTAIVYYSSGGTNYQLAQWAAEGSESSGF